MDKDGFVTRPTTINVGDLVLENERWMSAIRSSHCVIQYEERTVREIVDMGTYFSVRFVSGDNRYFLKKTHKDCSFYIKWLTPASADDLERERLFIDLKSIRSLREWATMILDDKVIATPHTMAETVLDLLDFIEDQQTKIESGIINRKQ